MNVAEKSNKLDENYLSINRFLYTQISYQYIKPGPHDPYLERQWEATGHGSPEHSNSFTFVQEYTIRERVSKVTERLEKEWHLALTYQKNCLFQVKAFVWETASQEW